MLIEYIMLQIDDYMLRVSYNVKNTKDKRFNIKREIYHEFPGESRIISTKNIGEAKGAGEVYKKVEEDVKRFKETVGAMERPLKEFNKLIKEK